jgi:hypothetical protein
MAKNIFLESCPSGDKKKERITAESILNWGRMVISSIADSEKMFYVQVKVSG